jgi:hypothetical protein
MKSALRMITSASKEPALAIVALLEVALETLDASGHTLPAVYIDIALSTYLAELTENVAGNFEEIDLHQ